MASRPPSRWITSALLVVATGVFAHCGSGSSDEGLDPGGDGGLTDSSPSEGSIENDGSNQGQGGAGSVYSALCGVVDCVPDDAEACHPGADGGTGGSGSESAAENGSESQSGGASAGGAAGEGGAAAEAPAPGGGAPSYGGEGGAAAGPPDGEGGASSGGGPHPPADDGSSCQVSIVRGKPRAACAPAGKGGSGSPCFSSADCGPGLGCVQEGAAARCLPFCCGGDSVCQSGSYCAERPLASTGEEPHQVPVCVPADDCNLNEPFPCGEAGTCSCEEGKACLVVRSDGTTTCAVPGKGKAGEACPCAWGYVCSQATQACVRLCETSRAVDYCGNSQCQASAELPLGWGVCLSPGDASIGN
jgi:hypothetical protein